MAIPGIGPQTATAILASAPDPRQFKSGRHFAAWLGLVPRQYSTGGKPRLGRITKLADKHDQLSEWAKGLVERRGYKRAAVALAAKNARIIWALLINQTEFKTQPVAG